MLGQFRRAAVCRSLGGRMLIGAALLTLVCGCGIELYEQRLEATKKFYEHLQLLDDNLSRDWSNGVVSIRMPLQFAEIPAPAPPATDPNNPAAEPPAAPVDPRKPDYATLELNGLKAAFKADLRIDGGNPQPGFIYLLSNHDFPNKDQAAQFKQNLVQELSTAFNVPVEKWEEEQYPNKGLEIFPPVPYSATTLTPAENVGGFPRRISIFLHTNGEVQTFIVFVMPQKVDGNEKINERIPLCLETLLVSRDVVQAPGQGPPADAGGGVPAAGGGAGPKSGF